MQYRAGGGGGGVGRGMMGSLGLSNAFESFTGAAVGLFGHSHIFVAGTKCGSLPAF